MVFVRSVCDVNSIGDYRTRTMRIVRVRMFLAGLVFMTGLAACCVAEESATTGGTTRFFETEIRPLLAAKCQKCHGAKQQRGGLRLDSRTAVLQGGKNGPAVVPGNV